MEIINHLAEGWSSKLIAHKLSISLNTVNNHRKSILHKSNSKNLAELLKYADRHRLLHDHH